MIEIIPAIDIIDGECVRLTQGDYETKKSYFRDPAAVARQYEDIGIRRVHIVDLDGAKASYPVNLKALERIATITDLDIQWGGGVRSEAALRAVFDSGAGRAICGSIAITEPALFREWLLKFGEGRMILGADVKDGFVATQGWLESSQTTVEELIASFSDAGLSQVICTDISKDGMLQGPSFEMYEKFQHTYNQIDITISGGISSMDDILRLNGMGLRSVIVGKAIYEGRITLKQIEKWFLKE